MHQKDSGAIGQVVNGATRYGMKRKYEKSLADNLTLMHGKRTEMQNRIRMAIAWNRNGTMAACDMKIIKLYNI